MQASAVKDREMVEGRRGNAQILFRILRCLAFRPNVSGSPVLTRYCAQLSPYVTLASPDTVGLLFFI